MNMFIAAAEDPTAISTSPGTLGFVFTFLMMVGAGFLIFDLVRRIRRVRYRAEVEQEISEEEAAIEEAAQLLKQKNLES